MEEMAFLVIARYLKNKGYNIDISFPVSSSKKINKYLKENLNKLDVDEKKFQNIKLNKYSLIIDSIFGIGINRKLSKNIINIEKINKTSSCIVSIDIASGINADSEWRIDASISQS